MTRAGTNLTKEQALQKLRHYCAYQERCHSEVREKLYQLGPFREHDEMIATLIQENYLNEERFAKAFAGGKWRIKKWGRVKIRVELKKRGLSDYCIRKGMKEIDNGEYETTLKKLMKRKLDSLKHVPTTLRRRRTANHFVTKGFEMELILRFLPDIT